MFSDFVEEHPFFTVIAILVLVISGIVIAGNEFSEYQCNQWSEMTGKESVYSNFDSCYVMTDSGLQRWDEYKNRHIAKDSID